MSLGASWESNFAVTRAEFWAENDGARITADEWLRYVAEDPELRIDERNGQYFAIWNGESAYQEPWLDWDEGNITTKWPDTALYRKMLQIASSLGAHIQDDEGTEYSGPDDWTYDPEARQKPAEAKSPSVWQRLFGRRT